MYVWLDPKRFQILPGKLQRLNWCLKKIDLKVVFLNWFLNDYFFLGSRDGWAPKHFKSSRENRIKESNDRGQKPEDFMDDEDMGDFGIAPQKIQNAAKFRKEKDDLGKIVYPK